VREPRARPPAASPRLSAVSDVVEGSVEGDEVVDPVPEEHAVPAVAPAGAQVQPRRTGGELVSPQAAAAVAATGFAVGAVTAVALSRRRTKRAAARSQVGKARKELAKDVVASRSFLVDVHLLRPRD